MNEPTMGWYLANLKEPVSQQILRSGMAYYKKMQNRKTRPKRSMKNPVQLTRYFFSLYLTGENLMRLPHLRFEIKETQGKHYISISESGKQLAALPIFDKAEEEMWNFITEGGTEMDMQRLFKFNEWCKSKSQMCSLIKRNFRADLASPDGKTIRKNASLAPRVLRLMRFYALIANYRCEERYAYDIMGIRETRRLLAHPLIRKAMYIADRQAYMQDRGMLTDLRVDLLKRIT